MSKPWGRAEDLLWEAVQQAVTDGWSPKRFRQETSEAWAQALASQADAARKDMEGA